VTAWQIHGFDGQKHPFPNGTQVVASNGEGAIAPEIAALDSAMDQRGMPSYVFNQLPADNDENKQVNGDVPGVAFRSLAAAKNEQGRLSRSLGGEFVHVELEGNVRSNEESRKRASSAIAIAMASAPRGEEADGRVRLASLEVEQSPISVAVNGVAEPEVRVAAKMADEAPVAAAPAKVAKKEKAAVRVATKTGDEPPKAQPAVLTVPAATP
jgi:hypothetical protein